MTHPHQFRHNDLLIAIVAALLAYMITLGLRVANRAGGTSSGRVDGTVTPGPSMPGDAEIKAENSKVDGKIKSICKGC